MTFTYVDWICLSPVGLLVFGIVTAVVAGTGDDAVGGAIGAIIGFGRK